ncbi:hypothetical protein Avbf_00139, partial [Armadillidium vulgare]
MSLIDETLTSSFHLSFSNCHNIDSDIRLISFFLILLSNAVVVLKELYLNHIKI